MRKLILISIFITILKIGFSQPIDSIPFSVERHGVNITYALSNWGLSIDIGGDFYKYDYRTYEYFGNHWGPDFSLSVFRRNLSLDFYFKPATINVTQPLDFGNQLLDENAKLNVIKTGVLAGYTINLPYNFGIQPQFGLLRTQILLINEEEIGTHFNFDRTTGLMGGISFNKYFKMKNVGEFIVMHITGALAYSNYKNIHNSLGNAFSLIEMGIGYHGWFKTKKNIEIILPHNK